MIVVVVCVCVCRGGGGGYKACDMLLDASKHDVGMENVNFLRIKAVFHCSRFARAGGTNKFQLLL